MLGLQGPQRWLVQLTGFKDKETKEVRELPRIRFPTNGNKLGLDSFEWSVGFLYHLIKILVDRSHPTPGKLGNVVFSWVAMCPDKISIIMSVKENRYLGDN